MRLPSIDLGNRRNRDYNLSTVSTSESTRSLASVLRHWQHPPAGGGSVTPLSVAPAAPPGTEAMRGNTLPTRSASSRSLASKISRAFVTRKQNASIDISAPISSSVLHPGLAVSDFGTPTRNSEGWDEFVRVVNIGRDGPVDERKYSVDRLCSAPNLPDIRNMSPMMPLSSTPGRRSMDHSSIGSPFFLPPTPTGIPSMSSRSNYSPPQRVPSKRTSHTRHNSLPTSVLMGSRYQHPYSPPSPQDTPTRPRNANRRGAFYERPPHAVLFDGTDPSLGRTSPALSSSMRSTTSSQFKIRRKPVPSLEIDTTEAGLGYPSSTSGGCSSRSVSGGSGDRSLFSSPSQSLSTCSPVEEVPPSIAYVVPLPTPRKDESFKQEIDMLFDELMEQCRTASPHSTPTRNKHQRSVSLLDPPRDGANLRRTHATTRKSVSKLPTSFSLPSIKQVDDERDLSDSEHQECHEKENAEPTTPRPKHHRVNDLRPFFPSGRSFEPIRAIAGKSSTPVAASATSPVLPATPRPGYVKNAVRQLERRPSSPVVTPVTKLGALLQQKARVDSDELTLESKRIMEEARRRRANTLK